ncbi:ApeI family dehydratase [Thalassotalea ganghwensis]
MSSLPDVIEILSQKDEVSLRLFIGENIEYFEGHFPQAAILPGVVQLDWAIHYAKQHFILASSSVKNVEVLKFQVVIAPNSEVTLSLSQKSPHKFTFSYSSNKGVHSSGRIVLEE